MPELPDMAKGIITSLVRWALGGLFAYLIQKGVLTDGQIEYLVLGIVTGLISIGWIIYNKVRLNEKLKLALALPAGTSPEELKAVQKSEVKPKVRRKPRKAANPYQPDEDDEPPTQPLT